MYVNQQHLTTAIQYTKDNLNDIQNFLDGDCSYSIEPNTNYITMSTAFENDQVVHINDWIVKRSDHTYFVCTDECFTSCYVAVKI